MEVSNPQTGGNQGSGSGGSGGGNEQAGGGETIKLDYIHSLLSVSESSDLSFSLIINYANGTDFNPNGLLSEAGSSEGLQIFNIFCLDTGENLESLTKPEPKTGLVTSVNYSQAIITQNLQQLNLRITVKEEMINGKFSLKEKTQVVKIGDLKLNIKMNNFEESSLTILKSNTMQNTARSTIVLFDPTSISLRASQFIKITNSYIYMDIEYGGKLTQFLEISAGLKEDEEAGRRVLESNTGKFRRYNSPQRINSRLLWKIVIYLVSWLVKIFEIIFLKKLKKKEKIENTEKIILMVIRKARLTAFGVLSLDLTFSGVRILLARDMDDWLIYLEKLVIAFIFFLMMADFWLIFNNAVEVNLFYVGYPERKKTGKKEKIKSNFFIYFFSKRRYQR